MVTKQVVIAQDVMMTPGAVLRTAIAPSGILVATATQQPLTLSGAPAIASGPTASLMLGGLLIGVAVLVQVLRKRGSYPREADMAVKRTVIARSMAVAPGAVLRAVSTAPQNAPVQAEEGLRHACPTATCGLCGDAAEKADEVAQQGENENVVKFFRLASAHVK